jgi:hypothetical protein
MAEQELESRIVILADGDEAEIHGPFEDPTSCYTHLYQNNDTRALDEKFGMDGKPVPEGDSREYELAKCVGPCSLGKSEVESTLRYFVQVAKKVTGRFIGFRENELRAQMERSPQLASGLALDTSLRYLDGSQGPYLVRKEVDGQQVLFPRNLPKMFL